MNDVPAATTIICFLFLISLVMAMRYTSQHRVCLNCPSRNLNTEIAEHQNHCAIKHSIKNLFGRRFFVIFHYTCAEYGTKVIENISDPFVVTGIRSSI